MPATPPPPLSDISILDPVLESVIEGAGKAMRPIG